MASITDRAMMCPPVVEGRLAPDRRVGGDAQGRLATGVPPTAEDDPMRASQKATRPPRKSRAAKTATPRRPAARASAVATVAAKAGGGHHEEAIAIAGTLLSATRLALADRLDLLDLCAESHIALGDLAAALADAEGMLEVARRARKPALLAQALNRRALVEIRSGRPRDAIATAEEAGEAARRGRAPHQEALGLLRLAEANFRSGEYPPAAKAAALALRMFKASGQLANQGRAWWTIAAARSRQGRSAKADRAAREALALARRCGDLHGVGNALNLLTIHERDFARQKSLLHQALAAFEASGYVERQAGLTHNLGILYRELGLYRRSRRLLTKAAAAFRRTGAAGASLATTCWMLANTEYALGHLADAKAQLQEAVALWESAGVAQAAAYRHGAMGQLALWENEPAVAVAHCEKGAELARNHGEVANQINAAASLSEAYLASGNASAALAASERATAIHRAHKLADIQGIEALWIWWQHFQALRACGKTARARRALAIAYRLLVIPIGKLTDEGLRRNYLNKIDEHRGIVLAWLADGGARASSGKKRPAHLAGTASLSEPFERLVDTGLRLNELRSAAELHEFLIDEATELSGAERVLLVLDTPGGPRLAGSLLPKGEDAQALLRDVAPRLDQVRRTRVATLDFDPPRAREHAQRSRIVAPLVARRELLGVLYADIDGAFGRFHDADRDLLAMLASQAAVALDNAQWAQGLEQKVAQRTKELRDSNARLEQRAGELALINSIQQGVAAKLDFQGIVNLVGDKLREVFASNDISIHGADLTTLDAKALYVVERGERKVFPDYKVDLAQPVMQKTMRGEVVLARNPSEIAAVMGLTLDNITDEVEQFPGTHQSKTIVWVPINPSPDHIYALVLESADREDAFSAADIGLLTTVAASMGVALENARLLDETQRHAREVSESPERQTATAEVLQVISGSMADAQPVFEKILDCCSRLFGAGDPAVCLIDGDLLRIGAYRGKFAEEVDQAFPRPLAGTISDMAVRQGSVMYRPSVLAADDMPDYIKEVARRRGDFSVVNAPMTWKGHGIGTIDIICTPPRIFSKSELTLVKTFADQAVIAIQNARLFNETQEALARQIATADILRVISDSPTDVQPVFDAIVGTAVRLLSCDFAILIRCDGSTYSPAAGALRDGPMTDMGPPVVTIDPARNFPSRAIISKAVLHLPDWSALELPEHEQIIHERLNVNCALYIPLLRDGKCIGLMALARAQAVAFTDAEIALAQSFVDQAVIAIQNARLFNETQEALERQTATAEVLKVISSSVADAEPVFDEIMRSCQRLFATGQVGIALIGADGLMHFDSRLKEVNLASEWAVNADAAVKAQFPRPVEESIHGYAIHKRRVLSYPDALHGPDVPVGLRRTAEQVGNFSLLVAPMLWNDQGIGALQVVRAPPVAFSAKDANLLKTFADQAVIAIQNARLFNETQEALERQTASADILRVISGSPTNVQPVFEAIVGTALRLLACDFTTLLRWDGSTYFQVAAASAEGVRPASESAGVPIDPAANFPSRVFLGKAMLHIPDWTAVELPAHEQRVHEETGIKASLLLPLLRQGECIGALGLTRYAAGAFSDKEIALAESFVDQAVIAIENVRLFNETREALEQQTATAEVLQVISSSVADTAPVFDKILDSCAHLFATEQLGIFLVGDDDRVRVVAWRGSALDAVAKSLPKPVGETMTARVIDERRAIHVPDTSAAADLVPAAREVADMIGHGSIVWTPMLWEGRGVGSIVALRQPPKPFSDKELALLRTFGDQAVIAIQNARMFNETNEALERQTATAEILRVISGSVTDTQPVFDAIVASCQRLFAGKAVALVFPSGQMLESVAYSDDTGAPRGSSMLKPWPLDRGSGAGSCILDARVINVADTAVAAKEFSRMRDLAIALGYKSALFVPLLGEGRAIGCITILRATVGRFDDQEVALAQTFADQAVIAIQNARLFNETKDGARTATRDRGGARCDQRLD